MRLVIAAARARPPSESYARPDAINRAPRLAYPMPSWRYARVVSPIAWVGKSAKQIEMSIAVMTSSTALTNVTVSNVPSSLRNFSRLRLARLQLELSRCMYSEQFATTTPLTMYEWFRGSVRLYVVSNPCDSRDTIRTVSLTA